MYSAIDNKAAFGFECACYNFQESESTESYIGLSFSCLLIRISHMRKDKVLAAVVLAATFSLWLYLGLKKRNASLADCSGYYHADPLDYPQSLTDTCYSDSHFTPAIENINYAVKKCVDILAANATIAPAWAGESAKDLQEICRQFENSHCGALNPRYNFFKQFNADFYSSFVMLYGKCIYSTMDIVMLVFASVGIPVFLLTVYYIFRNNADTTLREPQLLQDNSSDQSSYSTIESDTASQNRERDPILFFQPITTKSITIPETAQIQKIP